MNTANDNLSRDELKARSLVQLWQDIVALEAALGTAAHYWPEHRQTWRRLRQRHEKGLREEAAVLIEAAAGL